MVTSRVIKSTLLRFLFITHSMFSIKIQVPMKYILLILLVASSTNVSANPHNKPQVINFNATTKVVNYLTALANNYQTLWSLSIVKQLLKTAVSRKGIDIGITKSFFLIGFRTVYGDNYSDYIERSHIKHPTDAIDLLSDNGNVNDQTCFPLLNADINFILFKSSHLDLTVESFNARATTLVAFGSVCGYIS